MFCLPALPAWTQDAWASSCDRGKKWRRELEEGWARELTSYCRPGFLCLVSTRTQLLRWWPIGFPPIGYWRETTKFTQNLTCPCWRNWCAGTRGQFHAFSSLAGRVSKKEDLRMNLSPICAQPGFKYCYQREFYQNWSRRLRDECKNSSTVFKLYSLELENTLVRSYLPKLSRHSFFVFVFFMCSLFVMANIFY